VRKNPKHLDEAAPPDGDNTGKRLTTESLTKEAVNSCLRVYDAGASISKLVRDACARGRENEVDIAPLFIKAGAAFEQAPDALVMRRALALIDARIVDHLIVGESVVSLRERGVLC
jgi:hypothetical protein